MTTNNYNKQYLEIRQKMINYKNMIIKNHIFHYEVLEELISFQYSLNNDFYNFVKSNEITESMRKKYFAEFTGNTLFASNIQFLQSAFESLELGYIHPTATNLRSVYEGIPKMYYISFFPAETFAILIHELVKGLKYDDAIKKLERKKYQKMMKMGDIPFTEKNFEQQTRKKYTPAYFRRQIYDDNAILEKPKIEIDEEDEDRKKDYTHLSLISFLYGSLSDSTHANIIRNETGIDYNPKDTDFFFNMLKNLSYFNIHAFLETSTNILHKMNRYLPSVEFLNYIAQKYTSMDPSSYLMPSKPHLKSKLNVSAMKKES